MLVYLFVYLEIPRVGVGPLLQQPHHCLVLAPRRRIVQGRVQRPGGGTGVPALLEEEDEGGLLWVWVWVWWWWWWGGGGALNDTVWYASEHTQARGSVSQAQAGRQSICHLWSSVSQVSQSPNPRPLTIPSLAA